VVLISKDDNYNVQQKKVVQGCQEVIVPDNYDKSNTVVLKSSMIIIMIIIMYNKKRSYKGVKRYQTSNLAAPSKK